MSLRDEIAEIIEQVADDMPYSKQGSIDSIADQILALINAQRCTWIFADDDINTGCGLTLGRRDDDGEYDTEDMKTNYCWNCGKRIEVKDAK